MKRDDATDGEKILSDAELTERTNRLIESLDHRGRRLEEGIMSLTVSEEEYQAMRSAMLAALLASEDRRYADLEHEHLGCHVVKTGIYATNNKRSFEAFAVSETRATETDNDIKPDRLGWEMVESARLSARHWEGAARSEAERENALVSLHQAMLAYKNCAYHLAEQIAQATPSATREPQVECKECGDWGTAKDHRSVCAKEWCPYREQPHDKYGQPREWVLDEHGLICERVNEIGDTKPIPVHYLLERLVKATPSATLTPLEKFALSIMEDMREHPGDDMDGGSMQDAAEAFGLIHGVKMEAPCNDMECACAEVGFPAECMRETDYLRPLLARYRKAERDGYVNSSPVKP